MNVSPEARLAKNLIFDNRGFSISEAFQRPNLFSVGECSSQIDKRIYERKKHREREIPFIFILRTVHPKRIYGRIDFQRGEQMETCFRAD